MQNQAFFLEDIMSSFKSTNYAIQSNIRPKRTGSIGSLLNFCGTLTMMNILIRVEYIYFCKLKSILFRVLAIATVLFSILLVWCQLATPIQKLARINVSVFYWGIIVVDQFKMEVLLQV